MHPIRSSFISRIRNIFPHFYSSSHSYRGRETLTGFSNKPLLFSPPGTLNRSISSSKPTHSNEQATATPTNTCNAEKIKDIETYMRTIFTATLKIIGQATNGNGKAQSIKHLTNISTHPSNLRKLMNDPELLKSIARCVNALCEANKECLIAGSLQKIIDAGPIKAQKIALYLEEFNQPEYAGHIYPIDFQTLENLIRNPEETGEGLRISCKGFFTG